MVIYVDLKDFADKFDQNSRGNSFGLVCNKFYFHRKRLHRVVTPLYLSLIRVLQQENFTVSVFGDSNLIFLQINCQYFVFSILNYDLAINIAYKENEQGSEQSPAMQSVKGRTRPPP